MKHPKISIFTPSFRFRALAGMASLLTLAAGASATTVNITPTWVGLTNGSAGGNGGRVGFQGFTDQFAFNVDAGGTIQQFTWMNIGTSWIAGVTGPITSATVSFTDAYRAGGVSTGQTFKIFEVPGNADFNDYGRTAIDNFNGAGINGTELTSWYAGHTGYGTVTQAQIIKPARLFRGT